MAISGYLLSKSSPFQNLLLSHLGHRDNSNTAFQSNIEMDSRQITLTFAVCDLNNIEISY